jgi:hypothetical protein
MLKQTLDERGDFLPSSSLVSKLSWLVGQVGHTLIDNKEVQNFSAKRQSLVLSLLPHHSPLITHTISSNKR